MPKSQFIILALGVVLGLMSAALVLQAPAQAQTSFSECGFLTIPGASNGAEMAGRPPQNPIRVPPGWTPVGGGTYRDGLPGVVVCR